MRIGEDIARKAFLCAAMAAVCVLSVYFWKDLHLGDDNAAKIPDIVVENITVEREVGGRQWKLLSPQVTHQEGIITGRSLDLTIKEPDGMESKIFASSGTFGREDNDVTLNQASGAMAQGKKKYDMTAGEAHYDAASDVWHFSGGIMLTDGHVKISGPSGYFKTKTGECRLVGRGSVCWGL